VRAVVRGITHGLAYLHAHNKLHRDIKAANVLIASDGAVKLADFGVAAELHRATDTRTTVAGTPLWMAPELVLQEDYSFPVCSPPPTRAYHQHNESQSKMSVHRGRCRRGYPEPRLRM
jgi:serine/threonine protein kinase